MPNAKKKRLKNDAKGALAEHLIVPNRIAKKPKVTTEELQSAVIDQLGGFPPLGSSHSSFAMAC